MLVLALRSLLARSFEARVYIAAGKYTVPHVCDNFLNLGADAGLIWEEGKNEGSDEWHGEAWRGSMMVGGLDVAQLSTRKRMCRWWVGRWSGGVVERCI